MNKVTKLLSTLTLGLALSVTALSAQAEQYKIDTKGMHAFIQFRVQHLGYSWLYGRFNDFEGEFSYDEKSPESSTIKVTINTASVDTNHAERDKHLRSDDFLDVEKHPEAVFMGESYKPAGDGTGTLVGTFTLNGVTQPMELSVTEIGAGEDPWGGYRRGFEGKASFSMADFGIKKNLGPKSKEVELILSVEGIRQ